MREDDKASGIVRVTDCHLIVPQFTVHNVKHHHLPKQQSDDDPALCFTHMTSMSPSASSPALP